LINISTIYYTKIIGEDNFNVLRHVFDEDRLPEYEDSIYDRLQEGIRLYDSI
jgi:hypothetical protein